MKVHTYAAWMLNVVDKCAGLVTGEEKAWVIQYELKEQHGRFMAFRHDVVDLLSRSKSVTEQIDAMRDGITIITKSLYDNVMFAIRQWSQIKRKDQYASYNTDRKWKAPTDLFLKVQNMTFRLADIRLDQYTGAFRDLVAKLYPEFDAYFSERADHRPNIHR